MKRILWNIVLLAAVCSTGCNSESAAPDGTSSSKPGNSSKTEKNADTNSSPDVEQIPFVNETVTYREVDGHEILADVYRPEGDDVKPVIVWFHGGALISGHRESLSLRILNLAKEKGYAVVSFDYRLAPETKLPEIISDVEAAFRWLAGEGAEQFHLDPDRMVVCGGSAGGYLTLVSGYRAEPKPKALVVFWGYGNLTGEWLAEPSSNPRHNPREVPADEAAQQTDGSVVSDARERSGQGGLIYLHLRQSGQWIPEVTGFDPKAEADAIGFFEPVKNVDENYPPTLMIHGTEDTDVPHEQAELMVEQFAAHNVPHTLISIAKGEHGLQGADPDEVEAAYQQARDFIIEHLEKAP